MVYLVGPSGLKRDFRTHFDEEKATMSEVQTPSGVSNKARSLCPPTVCHFLRSKCRANPVALIIDHHLKTLNSRCGWRPPGSQLYPPRCPKVVALHLDDFEPAIFNNLTDVSVPPAAKLISVTRSIVIQPLV